MPKPTPTTPTAMRLLAPPTLAEGAWFCPYTGVLRSGTAAAAAATVAVFLIKSLRGSAPADKLVLFSIRFDFKRCVSNQYGRMLLERNSRSIAQTFWLNRR